MRVSGGGLEGAKILSAAEFKQGSEDALSLVVSQAEARMTSQNAFATAADQRASSLLSGSVALTAASAALAGLSFVNALPWIGLFAFLGCIGFILAARNALQSAQCVEFHPLGYFPSNFLEDVKSAKSLKDMRAEMAEDLEERLVFNSNVLVTRGKMANDAIRKLTITPLAAAGLTAFVYIVIHT
jgi:hypothetical protein